MKKFFIVFAALLFLMSCKNTNTSKVKMIFNSQQFTTKSATNQNEDVSALYFLNLGVVLHQYTPGFTETDPDQWLRNSNLTPATNWSHQSILQNNTTSNNILKNNEIIDTTTWNNGQNYILNSNYTDSYSTFSIDFIEVYMDGIGFITGTTGANAHYWGTIGNIPDGAVNQCYKYPEYIGIKQTQALPAIEGIGDSSRVVVLFARNDWFPQAMNIKLLKNSETGVYSFISSSDALTEDQLNKIIGLTSNGAYFTDYQNLIVIPYDGPIVQALTDTATGVKNPIITVKFDFTNLLTTESYDWWYSNKDVDVLPTSGQGSKFYFRTGNGVPFGLNLTISE